MRTRRNNNFTTVQVEGAILPADILKRIADGDATIGGLDENSYHLTSGEKINEAVSASWNRLLGSWANYKGAIAKLPADSPATTDTRERWLLPFFQELGYGRLIAARKAIEIQGKTYPVSHFWNNVPIHLVGSGVSIDKAQARASGAARTSPHGLVQEFLNRTEGHLWAFVSNGKRLRILRDNSDLVRQAFVEFDLESMMEGEIYSDFVLLWLLCHQSRVEAPQPTDFWLEKWSHAAQEQGVRALDDLRKGVEEAITALGKGFLAHQANGALRERLRSGDLDKQDYYRQLLRLAYRLIFLFAAEDRELLLDPAASEKARERYTKYYSTSKLRRLARRRHGTRHGDLYTALKLVIDKLGCDDGYPELGLPALGSFLFSPQALPDIEGCAIENRDLLDAIRALAFITDKGVSRQVDYKNLGSREMGSIYESLLELHPEINVNGPAFSLSTVGGNERKTSGSYYTPSGLINSLLDTALEPVLDEACRKPDPATAILALKVCDPACGSGHFLIDAAHRIAKRLATIRTGDTEPSPEATRRALRDVVGRCLYGIDVNPMSVELCKFTLWMEALEPGKPLSFLDHHVQTGNSLLGATPALTKDGIPDEAFTPIEGDDKAFCTELKRKNRKERETGQYELFDPSGKPYIKIGNLANTLMDMLTIDDSTVNGVRKRQERWHGLVQSSEYRANRLLADAWCAAFVWKKNRGAATDLQYPITEDVFRRIEANPFAFEGTSIEQEIHYLATKYQFFHFHLAFSDVFHVPGNGGKVDNEQTGWSGGFDVILGNPPWERIKLQEKEWFATRRPDVAAAPNAAARKRLIAALKADDPTVYQQFKEDVRIAAGEALILRSSGLYPLCGRGDMNTYAIFAERSYRLLSSLGVAGLILPTGIATLDNTKAFFAELMNRNWLRAFTGFDNEEKTIFPDIDNNLTFAAVVMGDGGGKLPRFCFNIRRYEQLKDEDRYFELSDNDLSLLNPNTRTSPIFRCSADARITRSIYNHLPLLWREHPSEENSWGIRFQTMFHMSGDSECFFSENDLTTEGATRVLNKFLLNGETYSPLYEAKMISIFEHRWAAFYGRKILDGRPSRKYFGWYGVRYEDPQDLAFGRYWVSDAEVFSRIDQGRKYFIAFRDITNRDADRTAVFTVIPAVAVGHQAPLVFLQNSSAFDICCFIAERNSFVADFVTRNKMDGSHLTYFILKQLPTLQPSIYSSPKKWLSKEPLRNWVARRVLELTYTSWDLQPFAQDCEQDGAPFIWDEERRFLLRCELDAAFFKLYEIPREEIAYILDTFNVLKGKEEQRFGKYRTRAVILEIYDKMAEAAATGGTYKTRLEPPPADPSVRHQT